MLVCHTHTHTHTHTQVNAEDRGDALTEERVGFVMLAINLPMALYFVYDVVADVREAFALLDTIIVSSHDVTKGDAKIQIQNPLHLHVATK
eukprot:COSAG05_NODE_9_length_39734_cov_180.598067_25_plen_91_part_00